MCEVREWKNLRADKSALFWYLDVFTRFSKVSQLSELTAPTRVIGWTFGFDHYLRKTISFLFICLLCMWSARVKRKTSWQMCIFFAGELHDFLGASELWTSVTSARVLGRPSNHNGWFCKTKNFLFLCAEYVWSRWVKRKTSWQKCIFFRWWITRFSQSVRALDVCNIGQGARTTFYP